MDRRARVGGVGLALLCATLVVACSSGSDTSQTGASSTTAGSSGDDVPTEQVLLGGDPEAIRLAVAAADVDATVVGAADADGEQVLVVDLRGEGARAALDAEIDAAPTMEFRPLLPEDRGRTCDVLVPDCHVTEASLVEATGDLTFIVTDSGDEYYGFSVAEDDVDDVRAALEPCVEREPSCPTGSVVQVVDGKDFTVLDLGGVDLSEISFDLRDQHEAVEVVGGVTVACSEEETLEEMFDTWHRIAVASVTVDDVPADGEEGSEADDPVLVEAVAARTEIPAYDGDATVERSMVERIEVDREAVLIGSILDPGDVEGSWAVLDIAAGTVLTGNMFFGEVTFGAC